MKTNIKQGKLFAGIRALTTQNNKQTAQYVYKFSEEISHVCTITQMLKKQLQFLYPQVTNEQIVNQFEQYLTLPGQMLGKRSSQIWLSNTRKYCIKLIDDQSIYKFLSISQDLLKYRQSSNNKTYLIDIFRIYRIESFSQKTGSTSPDHTLSSETNNPNQNSNGKNSSSPNSHKGYKQLDYFMLMPSLNPLFEDLIAIYDLKGYTDGRFINQNQFLTFKFGKDTNFISSKQLTLLKSISKDIMDQFYDTFSEDVNFLQHLHIIDYSLLVCFKNNNKQQIKTIEGGKNQKQEQKQRKVVINQSQIKKINLLQNSHRSRKIYLKNQSIVMEWAVIDYFQQYNNKKKAENKLKSLFLRQVSSVQPQIYATRFLAFIKQYFKPVKF